MREPLRSTETTAQVDLDVVAEAFRKLRNDDILPTTRTGTRARRDRIHTLLSPLAAANGVSVGDIAIALAELLPDDATPSPGLRGRSP